MFRLSLTSCPVSGGNISFTIFLEKEAEGSLDFLHSVASYGPVEVFIAFH